MSTPRVYADFNDLPGPTDNDQRMRLSYWGSLCDLARQRIRLRDGMPITVYDSSDGDEDMEVDGIARYNVSAATYASLGMWRSNRRRFGELRLQCGNSRPRFL